MMGEKTGYARVSTLEQNLDMEQRALKAGAMVTSTAPLVAPRRDQVNSIKIRFARRCPISSRSMSLRPPTATETLSSEPCRDTPRA